MSKLFLRFILLCIITAPLSSIPSQQNTKPYLWVYWEHLNGSTTMPGYIALCRKTLHHHNAKSFNIVELDNTSVHHYLPELKALEAQYNLSSLCVAQRVDLYRVMLLHKYGGLYLDSDMIVMRNLSDITDKLKKYDYVGFGQYYYKGVSYNSYGAPQNWAMASRKKGILITQLLEDMLKIVKCLKTNHQSKTSSEVLKYHALGKTLLQSTLKKLLLQGYSYYHYTDEYDGTRDANKKSISMDRIFSQDFIVYKHPEKLLFVTLYNWYISKMQDLKIISEDALLQQDSNFSRLIKQSLGVETL